MVWRNIYIYVYLFIIDRGSAVVKALCHKLEGR